MGSRGGSWVSELKIGEAFMLGCFQFCASRIIPTGRERTFYALEARGLINDFCLTCQGETFGSFGLFRRVMIR